ncbi:hypothetical protein HJG54_17840 [Leptolyngbya sp. NK1-12]|uniref:Uncharacterized protein n=1 Tax=Leptolyngbya sp. NK1-12 TaxID=2547451 RepID=A0AA96WH63_9CYAN|nr:hypothetical protein [Leptolyngbya sp. NK1-12]WNZ24530.1 hypothetical protein HJG54_17840 [Leptolyngbya sp. NK1-12]
MADFADRFRRVSEVAERLAQHEEIATALSQYPEAIKSVLEFGSEAVELLARRSGAGDNITPWLQRIDQSPQGREILEIYSRVDNALGSTNSGTVLEGQVALIAQENGFDVINFQKKFGPNGSLGEVDVETPTAILEMTVGSSGKLSQIRGLLTDSIRNSLSKPVILYAPNYGNTAGQDIINAGAYVVRTEQELIQLLTQLGQP